MNTKFSIIMPNYNSQFLYKAIKSVINQNYQNWELIVIDNFSENNPEKIIENFKDERIFFFKFNNHSNIAKSRNHGIKKAKYEWIAFLDSDDCWTKEKLSIVKKKIEEGNYDFLYHGMYYLPISFGFIKRVIKDKSKKMESPIFKSLIVNGNGVANSSVVVKKNLLININYLSEDKSKYSWEDYDCWIRCSEQSNNFCFVPKILGYCWVGGGNISSINQTFINYKNFHKIYKDKIFQLTGKNRLDWYNDFLFTWYFKKRNIKRAFIMQKKIPIKNIKLLIKSILIQILFYLNK